MQLRLFSFTIGKPKDAKGDSGEEASGKLGLLLILLA